MDPFLLSINQKNDPWIFRVTQKISMISIILIDICRCVYIWLYVYIVIRFLRDRKIHGSFFVPPKKKDPWIFRSIQKRYLDVMNVNIIDSRIQKNTIYMSLVETYVVGDQVVWEQSLRTKDVIPKFRMYIGNRNIPS